MKIGTKSLLFGMHLWFWHPIMVYKAWRLLYGRPTYKELVCIFIHDWGYWGKPNLDGPEGLLHPSLGANIANRLFGKEYRQLCSGHSRSYVVHVNQLCPWQKLDVSKLCWADKLSFIFEPRWFYLWRATISGELLVARIDFQRVPLDASDKEWFDSTLVYFIQEVMFVLADNPTMFNGPNYDIMKTIIKNRGEQYERRKKKS